MIGSNRSWIAIVCRQMTNYALGLIPLKLSLTRWRSDRATERLLDKTNAVPQAWRYQPDNVSSQYSRNVPKLRTTDAAPSLRDSNLRDSNICENFPELTFFLLFEATKRF
jgi:hypothetical protein